MILRSRTIPRKRRKPRPGAVRDPDYLAWLHTQPSLIPGVTAIMAARMYLYRASDSDLRRIEAHHVDPGNDRSAVPLYWWLHRETPVSVHGGGGRRRFEERFGISFDAEIQRLNAKYEAERKAERHG